MDYLSEYGDSFDLELSDVENKIRILGIQEKERQRIARDLHDYSLQSLTHLIHKLELCSMEIDDDIVQAKLEIASIKKSLKLIIEDIRNTIFDLRPMPFDDLGFQEVFFRLEEKLLKISKMKVKFSIEDIDYNNYILPMTLFRIIQEGAINSVKHSGGTMLSVSLSKRDSDIYVSIEDNGTGFEVIDGSDDINNHFGLKIMKERVDLLSGQMKFFSDESGTRIEIIVPYL